MPERPDTTLSTGHLVGLVAGVSLLLAVLLTAFAWPATNTAPRGVPVAVAAPPAVAGELQQQLSARAGAGAFEVHVVPDAAAAEAAIRDRRVYGAIVLGPAGGQMLTASAGSPAVAQLLTQLAAGVPAPAGPLAVTDVVPLPEGDPRGAGLGSAMLPLVLGGIISAGLLTGRVPDVGRRVLGAVGIAAVGGLVLTGILQGWLGALGGSYLANAGVVALGMCAVSLALLGVHRVLGMPGLGLGAAVVMLLGNPLSGVASAPELLPAGWGTLGQWLPPGATGAALRSVAFFDGAAAGLPLSILAGWAAAGLLLCLVPRRRSTAAQPA